MCTGRKASDEKVAQASERNVQNPLDQHSVSEQSVESSVRRMQFYQVGSQSDSIPLVEAYSLV